MLLPTLQACPAAALLPPHPTPQCAPNSSRPDDRPDPNSLLVVKLLAVEMVSDARPDGSALRVSRPSRRLGRRFWGFLSRSSA
jgi:hypothetical protein